MPFNKRKFVFTKHPKQQIHENHMASEKKPKSSEIKPTDSTPNHGIVVDVVDKTAENLEILADEQTHELKKKHKNPLLSAVNAALSETPVGRLFKAYKDFKKAKAEQEEAARSKHHITEMIKDVTISSLIVSYFKIYHSLGFLTMPLFGLLNACMILFPFMKYKGALVPLIVTETRHLHGTNYACIGMHASFALPCSVILTIVSYLVLLRIGKVVYRVLVQSVRYVFTD